MAASDTADFANIYYFYEGLTDDVRPIYFAAGGITYGV